MPVQKNVPFLPYMKMDQSEEGTSVLWQSSYLFIQNLARTTISSIVDCTVIFPFPHHPTRCVQAVQYFSCCQVGKICRKKTVGTWANIVSRKSYYSKWAYTILHTYTDSPTYSKQHIYIGKYVLPSFLCAKPAISNSKAIILLHCTGLYFISKSALMRVCMSIAYVCITWRNKV